MKKILSVQDLSCMGKCSTTVALPILSAMGLSCSVLPTAVLSTHTGFPEPNIRPLTEDIVPNAMHLARQGASFDGILVGYLANPEQAEAVLEVTNAFDCPVILDPAMADHGKRYSGLDEAYAHAMAGLCAKADILLPNVTEAAMLTNREYREELTEDYVRELLGALPSKSVVLTGVGWEPGTTGIAIREGEGFCHISHPKAERSFHGTGDAYAAAFVGVLMGEKTVEQAAKIAAEYVYRCIELTMEAPAHWYGIRFEAALGDLMRSLEK